MSSTGTTGAYEDEEKLVPEWGQSSDNQIIWLGLLIAALLGLAVFGLNRCSSDDLAAAGEAVGVSQGADGESVGDLLGADSDLREADDLFGEGDFDLDDLDDGPFTVFAPEDSALEGVTLTSAAAAAAAGYHVVEGRFTESDLEAGTTLETVAGDTITIGDDGTLNNGVAITDADNRAENGILHKIDGVLADEEAAAPAPTPEPTAVPEPEPTAVPEPEPTAVPEPEPTAVPAPPAAYTIADLAGDNGLTQLAAAAGVVGLGDAIADADAGPFTIFGPTDAAFAAAGGTVERMNEDQVGRTVQYHVVEGEFLAADLPPGTELTTIQGETLVIGDGTVNDINITSVDNIADNGVVHVIDAVLVPASVQRELLVSDLNELFQLEPIQFATGSAEILPESVPTLNNAISILSDAPAGSKVEIGGHTDSVGSAESNQSLSEARATSVQAYLTDGGVEADILSATGYGETELLNDPDETAEQKAENRRIEFKILAD